jgi:flavin-binding protein dodecin
MAGVAKVIQLVGTSDQSFSDAVRVAVSEASKTLRGISGVDVVASTAEVSDGEISNYRVTVNVAFNLERGDDAGS